MLFLSNGLSLRMKPLEIGWFDLPYWDKPLNVSDLSALFLSLLLNGKESQKWLNWNEKGRKDILFWWKELLLDGVLSLLNLLNHSSRYILLYHYDHLRGEAVLTYK